MLVDGVLVGAVVVVAAVVLVATVVVTGAFVVGGAVVAVGATVVEVGADEIVASGLLLQAATMARTTRTALNSRMAHRATAGVGSPNPNYRHRRKPAVLPRGLR